ncbi:uncharacterized protein [Maniola hyperantus]|uniref:uncharacterized protein n=1 Tax=Aphantopus hyperantus TaxID=2795564 RepID=UPI00156823E8|nr:uncharacterized protein LOC117995943 [Maniola hyperantus]
MVADLDMVILNKGDSPTFVRGPRSSTPDITIASQELAGRIRNWKVLEEETMSGHKYITYEIAVNEPEIGPVSGKWSLRKIDTEKFAAILKQQEIETPEDLINATTRACNESMPRKKVKKRKEVYWWNSEIADARRKCIECRRRYTRENSKNKRKETQHDVQSNFYRQEYKEAKFILQKLIIKAKDKCWEGICEEVDQDVWGLGYKIVTKKLKGHPPIQISMNKIQEIVGVLFPEHENLSEQ